MTVAQLIRRLEDFDGNLPVVVSDYNSGYGGLFEIEDATLDDADENDPGDVTGPCVKLGM